MIKWFKRAKEHDEAKYNRELAAMKTWLTRSKNEGFKLVFLDECMLTRKTVMGTEYTLPKSNM